jgi:epoxide hydrolase 4
MSSSSTAPEGPGSVSGAPNLPSDLREGYAEIGDQRLHYVEAGEGPLVVLLHGFPEFWYGWRRQIQPLAAAGFRVVAPDMRGYNLSSRPKDVAAYDVGLLATDIRDLIRQACTDPERRTTDGVTPVGSPPARAEDFTRTRPSPR